MEIVNGSILVNGHSTIFSVSIQFGEIGLVQYIPYSSIFISPCYLLHSHLFPSGCFLWTLPSFCHINSNNDNPDTFLWLTVDIRGNEFAAKKRISFSLRAALPSRLGQIELFVAPQGLGGTRLGPSFVLVTTCACNNVTTNKNN